MSPNVSSPAARSGPAAADAQGAGAAGSRWHCDSAAVSHVWLYERIREERFAASGVIDQMSGTHRSTEVRLGDGRVVEQVSEGRRLAARLLDLVLVSPGMLLFVGYLLHLSFGDIKNLLAQFPEPIETPAWLPLLGWGGLLVLVLYEPLMVARWGATVGKLAVGIRVVRLADGARVSMCSPWFRWLYWAAGRYSLRYSTMTCIMRLGIWASVIRYG